LELANKPNCKLIIVGFVKKKFCFRFIFEIIKRRGKYRISNSNARNTDTQVPLKFNYVNPRIDVVNNYTYFIDYLSPVLTIPNTSLLLSMLILIYRFRVHFPCKKGIATYNRTSCICKYISTAYILYIYIYYICIYIYIIYINIT